MTMSKVCFAVLCSILLVAPPSHQALAFSPYSHCLTFRRQSTVSHHRRRSRRLSLSISQIDKETRDAHDEIVSSSTGTTQDVTILDESFRSAGIPSWLQDLKETFYTCRRRRSNNKAFSIERVSHEPPIFVLGNFLSLEECDSIREQVLFEDNMQEPQTLNGQGSTARPNCKVAWLDHMDDLAQDVAECMLDHPLLQEYGGVWVENLQVLNYSQNGEYVLHHDGHTRLVTCIYYLNGVGGTWFPFANNNNNKSVKTPKSREEAISQNLDPSRDGVVFGDGAGNKYTMNGVPLAAGDAIVFYNYQLTPSGAKEDWRTLHAGLPTTAETKWIANHWFHVGET